MKKIHLSDITNVESYGIHYQNLVYPHFNLKPPFNSIVATVKPLDISTKHNHHETEIFYILHGEGEINENNETLNVITGDIIFLSEFCNHTIKNISETEELVFISFWWEDQLNIKEKLNERKISIGAEILVISAPPTPNGDLHVGHLSGPYFGADIYSRFMNFQGNNVFFLTGIDPNQTYVYTKSMQKDLPTDDLVKTNKQAIESTFEKALIKYDGFYDPTDNIEYNEYVQNFFLSLFTKGKIDIKKINNYYDGEYCLHEAFIKGECPNCQASCDGNYCEKCGLPYQLHELNEPRSYFGGDLESKIIEVLTFNLELYREQLLSYYDSIELMAHHKNFINELFEKSLPEIPISYPSHWGIRHKIEGFENQIIYVWAEMLPGYIYSAETLSDKRWNEYDKVIQFYGFDNTFYHLVLFPALLIADGNYKLPNSFIINEFLNLDGSKFSTSREHLIWAKDLLEEFDAELVRIFLAKIRPDNKQTNFSLNDFNHYINNEINNKLLPNIKEFWAYLDKFYTNKVPEPGAWDSQTKQIYRIILNSYNDIIIAHQYETFSTHIIINCFETLNEILDLILNIPKHTILIESEKDLNRTLFSLAGLTLKVLSIGMVGITPKFSKRLMNELNINNNVRLDSNPSFLDSEQQVNPLKDEYFSNAKN